MRFTRALAVLALVGFAPISAAQSAGWRSAYQEIAGTACPDSNPKPAKQRADREAALHVCRPFLGYRVAIHFYPNRHELHVTPPQQGSKTATLGFLSGLGPRIEWLGEPRGGTIAPRALIVRIGAADLGDEKSALLAVMKVTEQAVCLVGVVDVRVNPDANVVARREAERRVDTFRCGADAVDVLGESSGLAEGFIERLR